MRLFSATPIALLIVLSCSMPLVARVQAVEDGRIGVLYIGCIARSRPFWLMRSDPLFRTGFVQATLRDWMAAGPMPASSAAEVHRIVRLYMPRTYHDLVVNYDVIVLASANLLAVGPHIDMLAKGVSEGGLGLFMGGDPESFGGGQGLPPWGETSIDKLLPTEAIVGWYDTSAIQRVVIDDPGHELMSSLPWDMKDPDLANPLKWEHNVVNLKAGARQLAHVIPGPGRRDPLMVTWEVEGGARVFAMTSPIHMFFWQGGYWGNPWRYGYDLGCNLMIYLDRRPVPQDVALVHAARTKIFQVATRRSLLMSMLEFCESFGANTRHIALRAAEIDAAIDDAMPEYLQLRFEEMLDAYSKVEEMLDEMERDAIKLKNATLLWVYVVEWLAVTGTTLFCGFLLWSLMVRRRLYREVETTRMR